MKFFLHVSKEVQKERFLARLDQPGKEWKFNAADVAERHRFDEYLGAFEDALTATSTPWAPWYVVPADHWWITQAIVAQVLVDTLRCARPALARGLARGARREPGGAPPARGRARHAMKGDAREPATPQEAGDREAPQPMDLGQRGARDRGGRPRDLGVHAQVGP